MVVRVTLLIEDVFVWVDGCWSRCLGWGRWSSRWVRGQADRVSEAFWFLIVGDCCRAICDGG